MAKLQKKRRVASKKQTAGARRPAKASKPRAAARIPTRRRESTPPPPAATVETPSCEQEEAYTETLVATGQAARLDASGKLPAGATHKLVDVGDGKVKAVRRRFSIA